MQNYNLSCFSVCQNSVCRCKGRTYIKDVVEVGAKKIMSIEECDRWLGKTCLWGDPLLVPFTRYNYNGKIKWMVWISHGAYWRYM